MGVKQGGKDVYKFIAKYGALCKEVKFVPLKGWKCMIRNLQVTFDVFSNNIKHITNGNRVDSGTCLFMETTEPEIIIPIEGAAWIEIEADINYIG
ncbi:MAG: hypothetical protein NC548_46585 [Lachnospiraceae bacterium]|nr:hypothetical protein [Lachnospiraceae bacterium]